MESPVAAGGPRNTSVIVLTLDTNEVYIVVSLSSRTDTQVIYVDPTTGSLQHKRKPGYDVFNSQDEALNYITDGSNLTCKSTTYAKAILGYAVLGSFALLLVATKLTASIPYLPGGGCVYTISESKWIKVLLQSPQPQGKGEAKNIQELTEFEIDGKHYFCETRDITRPFPSRISVQSPDHEFVWNGWFSTAFKRIGLEQHCVILLQGFVEYRTFGSLGQQEGIVALIARRSRLHPGTRYLARGINSCYSTGNEIECEQLVWVPKRAGQSVPFNTYVWRRGTIPIWWGADLKMTAAEAVIYVSDRDPYKGSARYYQRLSTRYDARNLGVAGSNQNKGGFVPIVCVNLLRNGEGKSESVLVQHFEESLNHIRSTRKLPSTRLQLVNYDWHTSIRLKGEQQTIEGLWYHLKGPTISIGISEGDYLPSRQNMKDFQGEVVYNDDLVGFFCLRVHQNGVIRYNCADSLDRTNAASYFGSLQVFTEQCRRLGICLDSDLVAGRQSPNNRSGQSPNNRSGPTSPFSPGSKRQSTGAPNYTDLILKNSSGKHLYLDKPWKHFDMTFEEFKRSTVLSPVCQLADLFLIAGDIHATIYTGSKAMHSHILNIFSDEAGKSKQFAVAQNVKITLQRRYNNAVVDGYRQKQLEMFLGLRLFKHLPSVSIQPLHVLSRRSGCLLKPIASIEESAGDGDCLLSFRQKDIIWVSQQAADIIQLFIYLREPCHVCQVLLTISHGADDSTYPSTLDVRTGRDLDVLKLVVEGASIPRCASGTNMVIPLSGPIGEKDMALTGTAASLPGHKSKFPFLYNFDGVEGELDFLTRVVVVTFYPAESTCSPVTLGEVEILGISLPWRDMFSSEGPGQRLWENVNNMREDGNFFPSDTDTTPSVVALTSNKLPHEKSGTCSSSPQVDLLSGEDNYSGSVPQSMTEISLHGSSQNLCADHNEEAADSQSISIQVKIPTKMGVAQYISCFDLLTASLGDNKLGFVEAMELEIERLRLDISAPERDKALSSIGIDPATINPNALVEESHMVSLSKAANSLALLAQAFSEDRTTSAIGLDPVHDEIDIDFWNINRIGEECCGDPCQVRVEPSTLTSSSQSIFSCSACQRKACRVCCAGKGAILLVRNQSGGTGTASGGDPASNRSVTMDGVICKLCCQQSVLDALTLDYIRVLISQRRSIHIETASFDALGQVVGKNYFSRKKESSDNHADAEMRRELLNEEESLAEFPFGSFLHSVESASGSAPALSLLAPLDIGSRQSYWKAPPSTSSVEFIIVLGNHSDVSGVVLLVSPCGYSMSDSPTVQIWTSQKIHKEERSCVGKWDVRSLITSSPELSGPEKPGNTPRHIKFPFQNRVRCRLIWINLSIQQTTGSDSVSYEKDSNLLSLDEDPSSSDDLGRRASVAGTSETDPCLHAKRILVVGYSVKADIADSSSQNSERASSLKNWLEKPPLMNRYRVQVDSEKLIENDLVLEQLVSQGSPMVAGFRLDGFSAVKPRLTHSPYPNINSLDESSIVFEHRFLSPPVLHIQVSTLQKVNDCYDNVCYQGSSEEMVVVGEFRIPEVKGGTTMYFDLPKAISGRRIWFRVVGDVAGFADDPEEGDAGRPVAAGLSLLNRIKLYYYAHPNDLGRWASLSGI